MFDLPTFTLIHVVISVLGIISGLVVVGGLMSGARLDGWTAFFSGNHDRDQRDGLRFPVHQNPTAARRRRDLARRAGRLRGALYWKQLAGAWRTAYVITAVVALYLNVFVLVVQLFVKTPPLAQLAPTQQEAPFALTQALVLALFVWLGWSALRGFRAAKSAS